MKFLKILRMTFTFRLSEACLRSAFCIALALMVVSCASPHLQQGTSLSSYAGLTESGGTLAKANLRVDAVPVRAAQTVRLVPTSVQVDSGSTFDPEDLALVTNAVDRALCTGLSDRFQIVAANQPADLVVHATITDIVATGRAAAAISTVASLGTIAVIHVPAPRLPLGLGSLSVEAEAIGRDGSQKAAMLWARSANMVTTTARIAEIGDAYSLSSSFGADFSRMLITGHDPFKGMPSAPSMQDFKTSLGGDPKFDVCKAFGRAPGIKGVGTALLGLPPSWSDRGAATSL